MLTIKRLPRTVETLPEAHTAFLYIRESDDAIMVRKADGSEESLTIGDVVEIARQLAIVEACPVGTIRIHAGALPPGCYDCDGSAKSRAVNVELYGAIGTVFGVGDGSTTFNIPDLRDKFPVGIGTTYDLGETGGAATHALTGAEVPALTTGTDLSTGGAVAYATGAYGADGAAHNNLPPYLGVRFIIRAVGTGVVPE